MMIKKGFFRRSLATVLSAAMLITSVPSSALAEGVETIAESIEQQNVKASDSGAAAQVEEPASPEEQAPKSEPEPIPEPVQEAPVEVKDLETSENTPQETIPDTTPVIDDENSSAGPSEGEILVEGTIGENTGDTQSTSDPNVSTDESTTGDNTEQSEKQDETKESETETENETETETETETEKMQELQDLNGCIVYMDNGDVTHNDVDLRVYADGILVETADLSLTAGNSMYRGHGFATIDYSFKDLPKTDEEGNIITYTIKDANYNSSDENKSQTLFYINADNNIIQPNSNGLCEADTDLIYVGNQTVSGSFDITSNGDTSLDVSGISLMISAVSDADVSYHDTTVAALTKNESQSAANGAPVSYTWSVNHCLEYNPVTGLAITYRGQVTSEAQGYAAYYDNSENADYENDTDYVYQGGLVDYVYIDDAAFGVSLLSETNITISGQIQWAEDEYWTELVRPTELPADPETYLNLYFYKGDDTTGTKLKLQSTDPSKPNYIQWMMTEGLPYWNYTISNVSKNDTMDFYVQGPAQGAYAATDKTMRDTRVTDAYRMNIVKYNLAYVDVQIGKKVIPDTDENTFEFQVTAGLPNASESEINKPYHGEYKIQKQEIISETTTGSPIGGIGNANTLILTQFPKGLSYKVTEMTSDSYVTTYENQTGIAGTTNYSIVTNVKNDAKAELKKVWNDNNSLTRDKDAFAAVLKLQYRVGDAAVYQDVDAEFIQKYEIGAITFDVHEDNYNGWTVKALNGDKENFPAVTKEGIAITYQIVEGDLDGYVQSETEDSNGNKVLMNTKTLDYEATLQWNDVSATGLRPVSVSVSLAGYYLDDEGKVINLTEDDLNKMNVNSKIGVDTSDKKEESFSISQGKLPMYTADGHVITYYVTEPSLEGYETVYDNGTGTHGLNFTQCYNGGTIKNTVIGVVDFGATKVWKDEEDDRASRPIATMYLYRYSAGGSIESASPVVIVDADKQNHVIKHVVSNNAADTTVQFDFDAELSRIKINDGKSATLDQYDEHGREYTYFVKEVLSGTNSNFYAKTYSNENSDVTSAALKGGTVTNTRIEPVEVKLQKAWKTAAYPDVPKGTAVTYKIQQREDGDSWQDTVDEKGDALTITLDGFSAEVLTVDQIVTLPKYSTEGKVLSYQILETAVVKDGNACTIVDGKFRIDGHDYEFFSEPISTSDAVGETGEKSITLSGENRLSGVVDYTVVKKWNPEPEEAERDNYTATIAIERYLYDGTKDSDFETQEYTIKYADTMIDGDHWTYVFKDLPKYDEDGYQYIYKAVETGCTPVNVPGTMDSWATSYTYSYDADHYKTIVTNSKPGDGIDIKVTKEWKDDGDVQHRQEVVAGLYSAEGTDLDKKVTLSAFNAWTGYIHLTGTEATEFNYETCVVKEVSVGSYSVQYEGIVEGYTADTKLGIGYVTTDKAEGHIYEAKSRKENDEWILTNTRKGKVNVTVNKYWIDGSRNNAERPEISFDLYQDDIKFKSVSNFSGEETSANNWTYTFDNLEKYDDNGVLHSYQVSELDTSALKADDYVSKTSESDYDVTASKYHSGDVKTYTITNKREGITSYTVNKKWKDVATTTRRPDIYVRLFYQIEDSGEYYAYGTGPLAETQTAEIDYIWTGADGTTRDSYCEIDHLNKYTDKGSLINYYTQEYMNVQGEYKTYYWTDNTLSIQDEANIAGYAGNNEYIENRLESNIEINGVKLWKNLQVGTDAADIDATGIVIDLYRKVKGSEAEPEKVATLTGLQQPNNSFGFTKGLDGKDLSKYDPTGQLYEYSLKETIPGTMGIVYKRDPNGFQLINTFERGEKNLREIKVEKTWDSFAYTDIIKTNQGIPVYPDVTFELYRSAGTKTDNTFDYKKAPIATLKVSTASGAQSAIKSFEQQLVWSENGVQYKYAVKEVVEPIPGYQIKGGNVTYEIVDEEFTDLTQANTKKNVTVSFENVYTPVTEFKLTGSKIWDDMSDNNKLRPESIIVKVYRYTDKMGSESGALVETTDYTIDWKKDGNIWTYTISGNAIVKYAPDGTAWKYRITEEEVPQYKADSASVSITSASDDSAVMGTLTNRLDGSFTVTKSWSDNNNEYGLRPTSSYVKLQRCTDNTTWMDVTSYSDTYANTDLTVYAGVPVIKLAYASNKWSYTFRYLATKDANGSEYTYRGVEVAVGVGDDQYATMMKDSVDRADQAGSYNITYGDEADKTAITNTLIPTSLTVTKNWVDHSNQYDSRPKNAAGTPEIQITLQRSEDGGTNWHEVKDASGNVIKRTLAGSADTLSHTFANLPSCSYSGANYIYRAVENTTELIENYAPAYNYDEAGYQYGQEDGSATVITNTLKEVDDTNDVRVTKIWHDGETANHTARIELFRNVNGSVLAYPEPKIITLDGTVDSDGETTAWVAAWKNLPEKTAKGEDITYTVKEIGINGSTLPSTYGIVTAQTSATNNWTITNTELMSYTVVKNFTNDTYGIRPRTLTVKLERTIDGSEYTPITGNYVKGAANTASTGGEYTWTSASKLDDNLSFTFENLPKYDENGNLYTYRVREKEFTYQVDEGTKTVTIADDSSLAAGYVITNTDTTNTTTIVNQLATVKLTGEKVWVDTINGVNYKDVYRVAESSLNFTVYKETSNGLVKVEKQPTDSWTKNDDGTATFTFNDLPLFDLDGNCIKYHVKEDGVPTGYAVTNNDLSASDDAWNDATDTPESAKTITLFPDPNDTENTNKGITNTLQTVTVRGRKTWVETANGQATSIRPENVTLTLYQKVGTGNKTEVQHYPTVTWSKPEASNVWTYEYKDLPKYDKATGTEITYSVEETAVTGYTTTYDADSLNITNTLKTTEITAVKTWDDQSDYYLTRPENWNLNGTGGLYTVYADGTPMDPQPTKAWVQDTTNQNKWTFTATGLQQYNADGTAIEYTIREDNIPQGYTKSGTSSDLTNTLDTVSISGKKIWDDQNNYYQTRPSSITLTVQEKAGSDGTWTNMTKQPDSAHIIWDKIANENEWTYEITGLPKYNVANHEKTSPVKEMYYRVVETVPANYTSDQDAGVEGARAPNGTVTGADITNTLQVINLDVSKTWNDQNNFYSTRPEAAAFAQGITLQRKLTTDAETAWSDVNYNGSLTWNTTNANLWTYTYSNLPKYDSTGAEYQYRIQETVPGNYERDTTSTDTALVNNLKVTSVSVSKTWVDGSDKYESRPTAVVFVKAITLQRKLTTDPETAWSDVSYKGTMTWDTTNSNQWTYTYTDLPLCNSNSVDYVYRIKENLPAGYMSTSTTGTALTNTLETVGITATKIWNDQDDKYKLRPTSGDQLGFSLYWYYAGINDENKPEIFETSKYTGTWTGVGNNTDNDNNANTWHWTVTDLPKYFIDTTNAESPVAKEITYTVVEGWTNQTYALPAYDGNMTDGLSVTNSIDQVTLVGTKEWIDGDNYGSRRLTSTEFARHLTLQYSTDGINWSDSDNQTPVITGTEKNEWTYTYSNLPKTQADGTLYQYQVIESSVNDYHTTNTTAAATYDEEQKKFVAEKITNTFDYGTIAINKVFGDTGQNSNSDGVVRPTATFTLKQGNATIGTIATNENGGFTQNTDGSYTTTDSQKIWLLTGIEYTIQETGTAIAYTVNGTPQSFTFAAHGAAYTLESDTANHLFRNTPKRGALTVTKLDEKYTVDADGYLVEKDDDNATKLDGADFIVVLKDTKSMVTHLVSNGTVGEYVLPEEAVTTAVEGYTVAAQDALGIAYLKQGKLLYGSYTIVEVTPPTGYEDKDTTENLVIAGTEAAVLVDIPNSLIEKPFKIAKKYEPIGYNMDGTTTPATIAADSDHTFTFTIERVSETPVFKFKKSITTDNNGVADFGNLPYGEYTVTETTNNRYVMPVIANITVSADGVSYNDQVLEDKLDVENILKRGTITGLKVDIVSNDSVATPVANASIGLFTSVADDAIPVMTTTTDSDGRYTFAYVPYGETGIYYVREIQAPDNYQLSTEVRTAQFVMAGANGQRIDLSQAGTDTTVEQRIVDTPVYASLTISKTDQDSEVMRDVVFALSGEDWMGNTVSMEERTSDIGILTFDNIPVGEYTLTETKVTNYEAPDSFTVVVTNERNETTKVNTAVINVTNNNTEEEITDDTATVTCNIINTLIKRSCTFTKYGTDDSEKNALNGSWFEIYSDEACATEALARRESTTVEGAKGTVTFDNLGCGTYYIKEISAPDTFCVDSTIHTVTITQDGAVYFDQTEESNGSEELNWINEEFITSVTLTKTDAGDVNSVVGKTGAVLEKAKFNLYKVTKTEEGTETASLVVSLATNEAGTLTFDITEKGTYRIVEAEAPNGYVLDTANPYTATFTVDNTEVFQSQTLDLSTEATDKIEEKYHLEVTNVTYTSEEVAGISNQRQTGDVSLTKVDEENQNTKLSGVKFALYKKDAKGKFQKFVENLATGTTYRQDGTNWTSSEGTEGVLKITGLSWGSYYLVETEALSNYVLDETEHGFEIGKTSTEMILSKNLGSVTNRKNSFTVAKEDLNGKRLSGAKFRVLQGKTVIIQEFAVDELTEKIGELTSSDSIVYTLEETKAPDGYGLAPSVDFMMKRDGTVTMANGTTVKDNTLIISDAPIEVTFVKTDAASAERLAGMEFSLTGRFADNAATEVTKSGLTISAEGLLLSGAVGSTTPRLIAGQTYTLTETKAPAGHKLLTGTLAFTVGTNGTIALVAGSNADGKASVAANGLTLTIADDLTEVTITKVTQDGVQLAGAKLAIKSAAGEVVHTFTTGNAPEVLTGILNVGETYTLIELSAPTGYQVAADIPFTVNNAGVASVSMIDVLIPPPHGTIEVTKIVTMDGAPMAVTHTFYAALFEDEALTRRISDVKAIELNGTYSAKVAFTDLQLDKTYYVSETDEFGVVVTGDDLFNAVVTNSVITLNRKMLTANAQIDNQMTSIPPYYYNGAPGSIEVTKKLEKNGKAVTRNDAVFYVTLFTDPDFTTKISETKELNLNGQSSVSVTFTGLPDGVYYIMETTKDGTPVDDTDAAFGYKLTRQDEFITVEQDNDYKTILINEPTADEEETEKETSTTTTTTGETGTSTSGKSVKTGDETPIIPMTGTLALSALAILLLLYRRRKSEN